MTTSDQNSNTLLFSVTGMSCAHCEAAVKAEVAGVGAVEVDLGLGQVQVRGAGVDPAAVMAAVDEAGYDAEPVS